MRKLAILFVGAAAIVAIGAAVSAKQPEAGNTLKSVQSFASIADESQRSVALFQEAGKVITHARCMNCHPAGDRPAQGDDRHPHMPLVVRGVDNFGAIGMRCTTCHGPANFDPGGVPGHPAWHLAPIEMAWVGKSLGEICEQIKDPSRNGGMSMEQLVHHMAEDSLVGWGWNPGVGREPAPGTQKEFGALIKAWVDTGAVCPAT
ncbi:MAG: Isoquinoline 1-oxidoreductase subunit [Hyphomicrobium sp.]